MDNMDGSAWHTLAPGQHELNELRDQQKLPWRYAERRIVRAQAAVCARELPEYAFNADGWSINFSEGATKPSEADDLTLFERRKKHGLDNAEDYLMRRDPDLTREDAREIIADNIEICTELQVLMRPMNAVSGADLGGDPSLAVQRKAVIDAAEADAMAEETGTDPVQAS
jgi:hypothetical protein